MKSSSHPYTNLFRSSRATANEQKIRCAHPGLVQLSYIRMYICVLVSLSRSISIFIYLFISIYICIYVSVYIYMRFCRGQASELKVYIEVLLYYLEC